MSKTILLADDSVTIQKVIELTFMDQDFSVTSVSSGDEALGRLESLSPDFVVADVHMPGATGYQVARKAKELLPRVPVLLLVGTFEPFDEGEFQRCGADRFLKKPFDSQELLRIVEELSRQYHGGAAPVEEAPALEAQEDSRLGGELDADLDFDTDLGTDFDSDSDYQAADATEVSDEEVSEETVETGSFPAFEVDGEEEFAAATETEDTETEDTETEDTGWGTPKSEGFRLGLDDDEPLADLYGSQEPAITEPVSGAGFSAALDPRPLETSEESSWPVESEPADSGPTVETLSPAEPLAAPETLPPPPPQTSAETFSGPFSEPSEPPQPPAQQAQAPAAVAGRLSDEDVERIARRVAELVGERLVRDVAWEIIPDMAEVVIKDRILELESQVE